MLGHGGATPELGGAARLRRITFPPGGGEGRCTMPKKQKKSQEKIGERGEKAAARYLELMGFKILDRNWSCPAGEADIVAKDGEELVFVTVKARTDIMRGFPDADDPSIPAGFHTTRPPATHMAMPKTIGMLTGSLNANTEI